MGQVRVTQIDGFDVFPCELPYYEHQIRGLGGVICRVKIDPLKPRKPYTNHIWGVSPLKMEFNAHIPAV